MIIPNNKWWFNIRRFAIVLWLFESYNAVIFGVFFLIVYICFHTCESNIVNLIFGAKRECKWLNIFDFIIFVNIVCSNWLCRTFWLKNPEISEKVRHDISFPGDALYRIIILRYHKIIRQRELFQDQVIGSSWYYIFFYYIFFFI